MLRRIVSEASRDWVTRYVVRARFAETDAMRIVHHSTYLAWFEAGRVEYLRRRGIDFAAWSTQGLHFAVIEAHTRYRRPVRFDDRIVVETRLDEVTRVKVRFAYRLLRYGAEPEELMADGYTLLVCVDDRQAPRRLAPETLAVLRSPERDPRALCEV
jgi:acyl-CoA thioester hydrolase